MRDPPRPARHDGIRVVQMIPAESNRAANAEGPPVLLAEVHELRLRLVEAYATIESLRADRSGLEDDLRRLRRAASIDAMTGLWNRRFLLDSLDVSSSFASRHGLPLSLVLLDVDHFKAINDGYGHAAGDDALRDVAAVLQASARGHDVVSRFGGEEFAILLPGTDREGATAMAERVRRDLAERPWPIREVTASFGVATIPRLECEGGTLAALLLESADMALYHSKRRGRNRVTHADDLPRRAIGDRPDGSAPDSVAARSAVG
jgi:diguanylate cyclase (GGDEF)-like protein